MLDGGSATLAGVVGREGELAVLRGFAGTGARSRAVVLAGEAGIGKTTLWEAGIELARDHGLRVLLARPSGAEAHLSFAALIDLFQGVDVGALAGVPAPQRAALEVALLRAEPTRVPREPHAIALGVLNALRALAVDGPLVVAVDDCPWLDAPSADALVFAVRRLQGAPVGFLLARRPGRASAIERALEPWGAQRLEVGRLSFSASRRLLVGRLGLVLSRQVLRRIVASTVGNPLFILEVGRALRERGVPRTGEDIPLPDGVEELLGTRVSRLAPELRRLLLAVALSEELRADELAAVVSAEVVEEAADLGLLLIDGGRVRAAHPLLAAAAKKRSRPRERRELHLTLAEAVADETLRTHHLALARRDPDARLAAAVAAAAASACARGARTEAVELGDHALRLTPDASAEWAERLLVLASYLESAGEPDRLRELLTANLESIPSGSLRARAWLMLSEGAHMRLADYRRHLERALAEAKADPALHARIVARMSSAVISVERIADAEARTLEVLPAAERAGPEVQRDVLFALAWARALRGQPLDDVCDRWAAASAVPGHLAESPERVAGQRCVWRGEIEEGKAVFERLLALSDGRGELASYVWARLHLCELALRVGDWQTADRLLDEWAETSERELFVEPYYQRCRALLAAGRGLPAEAIKWAAQAIDRAKAIDHQWDWLEAERACGIAALLEQDPARAAESLRAVWEHTTREGVEEPGVFPVAPDLVEALVELGEHDEAMAVTARLRELSKQQRHPWGLATARRCDAVVRLAIGAYDERAAHALADVATDYGGLGLRFDGARSLLSLGRAQRRMKKWGPARESLESAIAGFAQLGSSGWARRGRSELGRVGGRRPVASGKLTATEHHVVELAANGRANKEIAQALSLAVHTVETHLSRAYAKLGVHSRSQLAGRF